MKNLDFRLDKWDVVLIKECKSLNTKIENLQEIWRKRCELPENYECRNWIALRLLQIIEQLDLDSLTEFVWKLQPEEYWKYKLPDARDKNILDQTIGVACSVLESTEVVKLPDYTVDSFLELRENTFMTHQKIKEACESLGLKVEQVPDSGRKSYNATSSNIRVYWSTSYKGNLLSLPRVVKEGYDTHARTIREIKYLIQNSPKA